jgi:hypothetical protein
VSQYFEILGPITNARVIAAGPGVDAARRLRQKYGGRRWRKMKGIALVRAYNGEIYEAEIHWYEAHGIGRHDFKIKKPLR